MAQQSVARQWNELLLDAIRVDVGRPIVHARNLFHVSGVMYDAWAAYDRSGGSIFTWERRWVTIPAILTVLRCQMMKLHAKLPRKKPSVMQRTGYLNIVLRIRQELQFLCLDLIH